MADHLTELEKWFLAEIKTISQITACCENRIANSFAGAKMIAPYFVFQAIPLQNTSGQAGTTIMSNFLLDAKFVTRRPSEVTDAISEMNMHFTDINNRAWQTESVRISIVPQRPISIPQKGASADEIVFHRGTSFRVYVTDV
jgi:hypothetical protein